MEANDWRLKPCELWTGGKRPNGYGRLKVKGKTLSAHRHAWTEANGPIAEGFHVCHHCDVRLCVELSHLFLGTAAQNQADMTRKGRGRIGDRNGSSKLTDSKVRDLRRLSSEGMSQRSIAAILGVTQGVVSRVLLGKSWAHVAD